MSESKSNHVNPAALKEMNWNEIVEPGAYVFMEGGSLARVPGDALVEGRSPTITLNARAGALTVRKLSDDPYVPISKARQLAADHDCPVNF